MTHPPTRHEDEKAAGMPREAVEKLSPAPSPAGEPLVSVVIRTIGRPEVVEALASVAAQTYPSVEVVLVDAAGGHSSWPATCGRFPLRVCSHGSPLSRSQAANAGLSAVTGEMVILLDEDDLFLPGHLADLVATLAANTDAVLAYADVEGRGPSGEAVRIFAQEFSPPALMAGNFIPLHAALFRAAALQAGCRFDEALPVFEDWDFFLQLERFGRFVHLGRTGAVYRAIGNSQVGLKADEQATLQGRAEILAKWKTVWTGKQLADLVEHLNEEIRARERRVGDCETCRELLRQRCAQLEARVATLAQDHQALAASLATLEASRSWRLTRPLRWLAALFSRRG
ncbi:MAG: glycosyltransferase [Thermoanaerobaculales bacterium]